MRPLGRAPGPAGHGGASRSSALSEAIAEAAELLAGDSAPSRAFLGGLVAGALVGAAVAGASLLRSRRDAQPDATDRRG